ncbi:anaphase-promoting complex subunit 8-like protein [Zychaea mexicana]|uniref:anaphase-promoting complex subunit 8-like protein n=1 Tax=Zychaea mexicana TaxID=64656 RepID=UPI0022FF309B|nr:anaphase-promoting complex subunit 8-like protein [Zychaea mexicana]KAI9487958.1 anaphase-promoting complex subunit 8-like protein [Zychaea mexicana]
MTEILRPSRELSDNDIDRFRSQLRQAILVCRERCLTLSAQWATEILDGIASEQPPDLAETALVCTDYESSLKPLSEKEYNKYQYARALFRMQQYDNVAFILKDYTHPRLMFLRLYAKFLAGEKRKNERIHDMLDVSENSHAKNAELDAIYKELKQYHDQDKLDAFNLYLYGTVLRKREFNDKAAVALLSSLKKYEYNWSAWIELGALVTSRKQFHDLEQVLNEQMPNSIIKSFFFARRALEINLSHETFWNFMTPLLNHFENSIFVKSQLATAFYDMFDYNEAEALFDQIRQENPCRLEDMDIYSNLLYLQGSRTKLSVLAHQCTRIDKYRPETCCIVANYHSARGELPESVEYFKRALALNPNYHLAWTLLGHDHIEMKNMHAAIECYRRAIDLNSRDYRAWYGLGQAYEILGLPFYATHYYQKSTELRPNDARMWEALGDCYELLQRDQEAIKWYKRAAACDKEAKPRVMIQLARTYNKLGESSAAAEYYRRAFDRYVEEGQDTEEIAEAGLFLARYYLNKSEWMEAEEYAKAALDYNFPYYEDGKSVLEEIQFKRTYQIS